ncbi:MAG TPA: hypothetical protein VEU08_06655 [Vicinamibacterales bacterium]|nr:hypothetical protein [Vicinamibacterales bacterium]
MREQIAGLTTRFEGLTARFDGLTTRFDGLTARFDGLTARVEGLTGQVDGLTTRFDGMPGQIVRDVMTQVRILHEDVIDRLKIIQEGQASKPRPGDRKKR